MKVSTIDRCVYIRENNNNLIIIAVYVDDLIIIAPTEANIVEIKRTISKNFEITDFGRINWYLGMEIVFSNKNITISQTRYIERILSWFKLTDAKPNEVPFSCSYNLQDQEELKIKVP